MQYRKDRYGNNISVLGYGCMRFTASGGKIDLDKAEKEVKAAVEGGVNYFDTAYIYPGNEAALGTILSRTGLRDKINIATKLPHYFLKKAEDFDKYFDEELKRLQTDHVDYYLFHMLTDVKAWERLIGLGALDWIKAKKDAGQVRQFGFSYHGNSDMFIRILDAYDWDFCQIQYNYLDENSQAGVTGLKYAASKGIPVIIMEPLRGGRLVNNLPKAAKKLFEDDNPALSPAIRAFLWLWNQPEVTCTLSGMNSLEMVEENVRAASEITPGSLTEKDMALYAAVIREINASMKVGCTGCRYCMPCPKGVDIPGAFAAYNAIPLDGKRAAFVEYFKNTAIRRDYTGVSNCIGCGACEQHCPQGISIRKELKNVKKALEGPVYRIGRKLVPLIMKY